MMGLSEIIAASNHATRRARARQVLPYMPNAEQLKEHAAGNLAPAYIPFMGDYVPRGWRIAETETGDQMPALFVDTYGLGSEREPALSWRGLALSIAGDAGRYAYGTIEAGQFQNYVARFERVPYVPRAGHRVEYVNGPIERLRGLQGKVIRTRKHGDRASVLFDVDAGKLGSEAHSVECFPSSLRRVYKVR